MASVRAEEGRIRAGDGVELFYRRAGHAGGGRRALVAPSASWLGWDLDELAAERVLISYDLRGRGRSSAVDDQRALGIEQDVGDLRALCAGLDLERVDLFGWSYHALVAVRFALARPAAVGRLVLVGPSAPVHSPYYETFLDRFGRRLDAHGLKGLDELRRRGTKASDPLRWSQAVHQLFLRAYVADPACLARMRSAPWVEPNLDPDRVNNLGRRVLEKLGRYDWRAELARLAAPVLLVHGSEDPVDPAGSEEWLRALPAARLLSMDGVGHMPWLERPAEFFPAVSAFLDGPAQAP
jgi:proline iminopeptidase